MEEFIHTVDVREVEKMINEGNKNAKLVHEAMTYQIAKGIGELATVVLGKVDAIILTGGIAYSSLITENIRKRVEFISDVCVMPGENELEALSKGILRVLNKEEEASVYRESILAKS